MDYERLKTFIAVAEKKSFSEAAKSLYVTQPTISAQIKALEEEVGAKLFERTTKKVELTQPAAILLKYAKKIIYLSEMAQKEMRKFGESTYGELKIGCSFTIGEYFLTELIKEFQDDCPLVQFSVDITNSNNVVSDIIDQKIDVGLIETPIEEPHIVMEPFMEDELILIAAPGFFPENEITVSIDRLKEIPLIVREKGSGTRAVVNQHLQKAGLPEEELNIIMELGSTEAVKSAVSSNLGVSIISKSAIKKELKLKLLKQYPVKDLSFYRYFYVAVRKDKVLNQSAERFIEKLKAITCNMERGAS